MRISIDIHDVPIPLIEHLSTSPDVYANEVIMVDGRKFRYITIQNTNGLTLTAFSESIKENEK